MFDIFRLHPGQVLDRLVLLVDRSPPGGRWSGPDVADLASALVSPSLGGERGLADRRERLSRYRARLAELVASPGVSPQRSPAWHEARASLITASDVA